MRWTTLLSLIGIILLGLAIRLFQLDSVSMRGDEAFSALYWAGLPIQRSLTEIATIEPHPPLTYILFRLWGLFLGIDSAFALRYLPLIFNVLGIPATYALGKRLFNVKVGLLAALLWALHPFLIWHSQDFRNYAIWSGLSIISLWLGYRLLSTSQPNKKDWALYAFFAAFAALLFYTEVLTMFALALFAIYLQRHHKKFLLSFLALQACIVALVVLSFFLLQSGIVGSGSYGGTAGGFVPIEWLTIFIPTLVLGETSMHQLSLIAPAIFLLFLSFVLALRVSSKNAWFLGLQIAVPLVLVGLISIKFNMFLPRYVMTLIPSILILLSAAIVLCWQERQAVLRILSLLMLIFILITNVLVLNQYFTGTPKTPDWETLTRYLEENVSENDLVIQTSTDAAFGYYYQGAADDIGMPINPVQPIDEIVQVMQSAAQDYDSIWVVANTFSNYPNAGVVENWVAENRQLVRESFTRQPLALPIRQWRKTSPDLQELALATEINARFEDLVDVVGFQVFDKPDPSGNITVWVYMKPISNWESSLKTFLHLYEIHNDELKLVAQDDHFPLAGQKDAQNWETDTLYREVFVLPASELKNGEFVLGLGFYDPLDNTRITLTNGDDVLLFDRRFWGEFSK